MKAKDITVGGLYVAKVNNRLVVVRVDAIREVLSYRSVYRTATDKTVYDVTNTSTGRKTTFRSAAKFHYPATVGGKIRIIPH